MLKSVANNYKDYLFALVSAIFLFCVAINFNDWAYDEYSAVVSQLELDDPRVIITYAQLIASLGIPAPVIDYVISPILSVVIVPLRWTYAIGISPLYAIIRIDSLSWDSVKILLHIAHSVIAFVGLSLIALSVPKDIRGAVTPVMFSLILLSSSFVYWSGTFTSYSYHLLCFGLLASEYVHKNIDRNSYFGGSSIMRTLIILLNYQYIFVLVCLGSGELLSKRGKFFREGFYKGWILPAIVTSLSIVAIFVRLHFSGADTAPTLNYPEAQALTLAYDGSIDGIANLLQMFSSRLLEITQYYFSGSGRAYFILSGSEDLSIWASAMMLFFLFIGAYILNHATRCNLIAHRLLKLCFILLGSQCLLYIFGILPMSATRHSLIIFLPSVVIFSLAIYVIYIRVFGPKLWLQRIGVVGFLVAIFYSGNHFSKTPIGTESGNQVNCLVASSIDTFVLDACFLEPLLQNKLNRSAKFFYSCGPYVIDKIDGDTETVAYLSRDNVEPGSGIRELAKYSDLSWKPSGLELPNFDACINGEDEQGGSNKEMVKIKLFEVKG